MTTQTAIPWLHHRDRDVLVSHEDEMSLSLYMPLVSAGPESRGNRIELKNLLREARQRLQERGARPTQADELLASLRSGPVEADGSTARPASAMACFLSPQGVHQHRLPYSVEAAVIAGSCFHVTPVLPILSATRTFGLLALSPESVRLFVGSRYALRQIQLPGCPRSIDEIEALYQDDNSVQWHTGTAPAGPGQERPAAFHGQGAGVDQTEKKKRREEFCRRVDAAVCRRFQRNHNPLVLAAAEPLHTLYCETTHHKNLVAGGIKADPHRMTDTDLFSRAMDALADWLEEDREEDAARVRSRVETPYVLRDVRGLLNAAANEQIDVLLVARGARCWGRMQNVNGGVMMHDARQAGDEDLLNRIAVSALQRGARVHQLDRDAMPGKAPLAGLLRFVLAE